MVHPFLLDDLSQPPGHGSNQLLQVVIVVQLQDSQLRNLSFLLLHVFSSGIPRLHLHPGPDIFYKIHVRTVSWPLDQLDVRPLSKPVLHNLGGVAWGPILEKARGIMPLHEDP